MRTFRVFLAVAAFSAVAACRSQAPTPMTWHTMITHIERDEGLTMLAQIQTAPQPLAAKDLMAPAILLLTRGELYKEAQDLAGLSINTFPNDPLYHQLLGEAYQATMNSGNGSSRIKKKMRHEFERAQQLRKSP